MSSMGIVGYSWQPPAKSSSNHATFHYSTLNNTCQIILLKYRCYYIKTFTGSKMSEANLTAIMSKKTSKLSDGNFVKDVLEKDYLYQNSLYQDCWLIAYSTGSGWQKDKKVLKFPTNVNKTIILNSPPMVSKYQFSVSICKVFSTKMAFQL